MKLIEKHLDISKSGSITLVATDTEDIYHAYNLISVGDQVASPTIRNVKLDHGLGVSGSSRVLIPELKISVTAIDCDLEAGTLRLSGRNLINTDHVEVGEYHTLQLDCHRRHTFTIFKAKWDSVALELINNVCRKARSHRSSNVAVILMEEGLANICLVRRYTTSVRAKIEVNIPRKRVNGMEQRDKGLHKFYDKVAAAISEHIDFTRVKCVVLASPGFVSSDFMQFMGKYHSDLMAEWKEVNFTVEHSSSGHMSALPEVLKSKDARRVLEGTVAVDEILALENFLKMLEMDSARAFYGPAHVSFAAEKGAIETMLISDNLFRSTNIAVREKYVALVELVRDNHGDVMIISSNHSTGEQLDKLTGVAAILRFPMEDLDLEPMEDLDLEPMKDLDLEPMEDLNLGPMKDLDLEPMKDLGLEPMEDDADTKSV